jgi:hypothetical protein
VFYAGDIGRPGTNAALHLVDERIVAHRDRCCASCSSTIRTARSRTSGKNLFVVLLVIAPPSQELEPPTNPGRFTILSALDAVRRLHARVMQG